MKDYTELLAKLDKVGTTSDDWIHDCAFSEAAAAIRELMERDFMRVMTIPEDTDGMSRLKENHRDIWDYLQGIPG